MNTRRDFIKWVIYLSATPVIPMLSTAQENPKDILEGISFVQKKMVDLSGKAPHAYRAQEDDAFERVMREFWHDANGGAPYHRIMQDMGLQPARRETHEDGTYYDRPESYVTLFQYRRA